jgi:hypothetical protein
MPYEQCGANLLPRIFPIYVLTFLGIIIVCCISSWNMETRRKAVDVLASYGKKALPSLTRAASAILWYPKLKHYVLDKIKQINEGAI